MEFLRERWYLVLGALVLIFLVARSRSQATTVSGGTDSTTLQLANLSSQERATDEANKYGLAQSLLNYDLAIRQQTNEQAQFNVTADLSRLNIGNQIQLAQIAATSNNAALASQYSLAQLAYNTQLQQAQLQAQLQRQAVSAANAQSSRQAWLTGILGGLGTLIPTIFGNHTSGGSMQIPTIGFPGSGGGGIFGGNGGGGIWF